MAKGRVKWFDPKKGFGFILNQDGQDVFVHYTGIEQDGFRCLRSGQVVEYEPVQSSKGMQGWKVRVLTAEAPLEAISELDDPEPS